MRGVGLFSKYICNYSFDTRLTFCICHGCFAIYVRQRIQSYILPFSRGRLFGLVLFLFTFFRSRVRQRDRKLCPVGMQNAGAFNNKLSLRKELTTPTNKLSGQISPIHRSAMSNLLAMERCIFQYEFEKIGLVEFIGESHRK